LLRHQQIKEQHELSVLTSFISFLSTDGKDAQLIARPDPPDAIVTIDGRKTWIEITDAYFSEEVAKRITAFTANNKSITNVNTEVNREVNGFLKNCNSYATEASYSDTLLNVILGKFSKATIKNIALTQGPGILLVGIYSPYATAEELIISESKKINTAIQDQAQLFTHIYIYQNNENGHSFYPIL